VTIGGMVAEILSLAGAMVGFGLPIVLILGWLVFGKVLTVISYLRRMSL
jgi:hypothetical protein